MLTNNSGVSMVHVCGRSPIWIAVLLAGCAGDGRGGVDHPLATAVDEFERRATVVIGGDTIPSKSMNEAASVRWTTMRRRIMNARPGVVMGDLEGGGAGVLGGGLRVALGRADRVFVLDRRTGRVVIFDWSGEAVESFGGIGDGPRQFRWPEALAVVGDSLFVAQAGGVKVFVRGAEGYEWDGQLPIDVSPRSLCVDGDAMIVNAAREPVGTIRRYGPDGSEEIAFGGGYMFGSEGTRRALSQGFVACGGQPTMVAYGHQDLPIVEGFAGAGKPMWSVFLEDYVQGYWREMGNSRGAPIPPMEVLSNVIVSEAGYVLVSYDRQRRRGQVVARTYLLDARTGEGGLLEEDEDGRRILAVGDTTYVTNVPGSYPRLQLWHMESGR